MILKMMRAYRFLFCVGILAYDALAFPTEGPKPASNPNHCLLLTPDREAQVEEAVERLTQFINKLTEELELIDLKYLNIVIDGHYDDETEDREMVLELTVNNCARTEKIDRGDENDNDEQRVDDGDDQDEVTGEGKVIDGGEETDQIADNAEDYEEIDTDNVKTETQVVKEDHDGLTDDDNDDENDDVTENYETTVPDRKEQTKNETNEIHHHHHSKIRHNHKHVIEDVSSNNGNVVKDELGELQQNDKRSSGSKFIAHSIELKSNNYHHGHSNHQDIGRKETGNTDVEDDSNDNLVETHNHYHNHSHHEGKHDQNKFSGRQENISGEEEIVNADFDESNHNPVEIHNHNYHSHTHHVSESKTIENILGTENNKEELSTNEENQGKVNKTPKESGFISGNEYNINTQSHTKDAITTNNAQFFLNSNNDDSDLNDKPKLCYCTEIQPQDIPQTSKSNTEDIIMEDEEKYSYHTSSFNETLGYKETTPELFSLNLPGNGVELLKEIGKKTGYGPILVYVQNWDDEKNRQYVIFSN